MMRARSDRGGSVIWTLDPERGRLAPYRRGPDDGHATRVRRGVDALSQAQGEEA